MRLGRRAFALGAVSMGLVACMRPNPRPTPATPAPLPQIDAWRREAVGMLTDSLGALRTFDVFVAFRATSTGATPPELEWDPPSSTAWTEATHVARGLHGRADQLFQAVANAHVPEDAWRDQRAMADGAHAVLDLGDALAACLEQFDRLSPGGAGPAVPALDGAWTQWSTTARLFGLSRAEPIAAAG